MQEFYSSTKDLSHALGYKTKHAVLEVLNGTKKQWPAPRYIRAVQLLRQHQENTNPSDVEVMLSFYRDPPPTKYAICKAGSLPPFGYVLLKNLASQSGLDDWINTSQHKFCFKSRNAMAEAIAESTTLSLRNILYVFFYVDKETRTSIPRGISDCIDGWEKVLDNGNLPGIKRKYQAVPLYAVEPILVEVSSHFKEQKAFAKALGVNRNRIGKLMTGYKKMMNFDFLGRLLQLQQKIQGRAVSADSVLTEYLEDISLAYSMDPDELSKEENKHVKLRAFCLYQETKGRSLRSKLTECYIPMVYGIKREHFRGVKSDMVDVLIAEGMSGLLKAIDRFDQHKCDDPSTYMYNTIWGSMMDALRKNTKYRSSEKVILNMPIGNDGEFMDMVAQQTELLPEEQLHLSEQKEWVREQLSLYLEPEDVMLLEMKYGFGTQPHTHKKIGEKFGFSKYTSWYREQRALKKLRTRINRSCHYALN